MQKNPQSHPIAPEASTPRGVSVSKTRFRITLVIAVAFLIRLPFVLLRTRYFFPMNAYRNIYVSDVDPRHPACVCLWKDQPSEDDYDYDFLLREFENGTLHVYPFCRGCGVCARSPVKRETVSLQKWRELLRSIGREVR